MDDGQIKNLSEDQIESENGSSSVRIIRKLADLPEKTILDEGALARVLKVCRRTIRNMVDRNELPPAIPFAGRSSWIIARVLAHFEKRADEAARSAERATKKLES